MRYRQSLQQEASRSRGEEKSLLLLNSWPPAIRRSGCYARAAAVFARAFFAVSASRANEAGDDTARSARLLRSSVLPDAFSPAISCPYVSPCSRAAALMRWIHSVRKSRFFRRRPTNAYLSAVSTD